MEHLWQAQTLPIARYRLSARVVDPLLLPQYAGSLLRGQFGAALRHLACMTKQPHCGDCPLRTTCPYASIFEAPAPEQHQLQRFNAIPNAYVVEAPPPAAYANPAPDSLQRQLQPGQIFDFHMVLIGKAIAQLPLLVFAWQRALAHGLGKRRSRLQLEQVDWLDAGQAPHPVWKVWQPRLQPHPASLAIPVLPQQCAAFTLHFYTPLRLQHSGRALPQEQFTPRTLISSIARRTALVLEFHAGQPHWGAHVPEVVQQATQLQGSHQFHKYHWRRFSSRQQQEMALDGLLGQWRLQGHPQRLQHLWPWLWLGQWLHIGKNATMGLGGYHLHAEVGG